LAEDTKNGIMIPKSFLGSRADALMDIVILSLVVIVPIILYSWKRVKNREYSLHRNIQTLLTIVLFAVVFVFEMDMRAHGGIFKMVEGSTYSGTTFLNASVYIHTFFSITTSIIWVALIIFSWLKFPNPPSPAGLSKTHKLWGRIGMWDMILTGITGVQLYVFGFLL
jgi:uncharacterized membrane protein YozB (DUF420 family)